jgi:hypothetical protein
MPDYLVLSVPRLGRILRIDALAALANRALHSGMVGVVASGATRMVEAILAIHG